MNYIPVRDWSIRSKLIASCSFSAILLMLFTVFCVYRLLHANVDAQAVALFEQNNDYAEQSAASSALLSGIVRLYIDNPTPAVQAR